MKILNSYSLRAKNRTESAAMNGGMEIGLTILVFVLLGMAIDNWLGTKPAFVIALFLFAAIGSGLRYYYIYTADMERLEAERAAARSAPASSKSSGSTATGSTATGSTATGSTSTRSATITSGSTQRAVRSGLNSPVEPSSIRATATTDAAAATTDAADARRKVSA